MKITMELSMQMNGWAAQVKSAAFRHCYPGGIYEGSDGARRLARECGIALADFGEAGEYFIPNTYSTICVLAYNLKPPIDAKVWNTEMRESYNEQMQERKEHIKALEEKEKQEV